MNNFEFVQPRTLDEALAAAAAPGAAFLAGGTNLVDLMKAGVVRPARLVHLAACRGSTASRRLPTAAFASARWCATPISQTLAEPISAGRGGDARPGPRRNCATPPPSAAI